MYQKNLKSAGLVVFLVVFALFSHFFLSLHFSSPDQHKDTIAALDNKRTTVMELTAASTAASAAITLLPGDAATPIANKLTDLSGYFLLVLCAIYLEKYLVTISCYITFAIMIPVACIMFATNIHFKNKSITQIAVKLIVFGLAVSYVVPASVKISNMIEDTYSTSIQITLDSATESTNLLGNETAIGKSSENSDSFSDEEETGIISAFFNNIKDGLSKVTEGVTDVANQISTTKDNLVAAAQNVLNNFIEALAVMIITSCVIPILVILLFIWIIKLTLGINIDLPKRESKVQLSEENSNSTL